MSVTYLILTSLRWRIEKILKIKKLFKLFLIRNSVQVIISEFRRVKCRVNEIYPEVICYL